MSTMTRRVCVQCGKSATERCSRCHQVYYCSEKHQREHWSSHRSLCNQTMIEQSKGNTDNGTATGNKCMCEKETKKLVEEQAHRFNRIERQLEGIQISIMHIEKAMELLTSQTSTKLEKKCSDRENITAANPTLPTNRALSGIKKKQSEYIRNKSRGRNSGQHITTAPLYSSLHVVAAQGNVSALRFILDRRPHDIVDENGWTALMHAANGGHEECVSALLEYGFKNVTYDIDGFTPLHRAAQNGQAECISAILQRSVHPDCTTILQSTPLHFSAMNGHAKSLNILLNGGASVNAADSVNMTALHYAADNGYEECVEMLIKFGAKINIKSIEGHTPIHYAAARGHEGIIHLLVEAGADLTIRDEEGNRPVDRAAKYAPEEKREVLCNKLKPS